MSLYAIGDVQGCLSCLKRLFARIEGDADRLWFVGDLVNRGPDSAGVLRWVRSLGAHTVLGNHDLHLLAVAAGARPAKPKDTFQDVLESPDREALLAWLAHQPLIVHDKSSGWAMVHAGLVPQWDIETAAALAREVEALLRRNWKRRAFLEEMYGDEPERWDDGLEGMSRARFVINAMTRMRFCDHQGRLALEHSGPPGSQPPGYHPWFELWPHDSPRLVFGHWSTLGAGDQGRAVSTDSGCVWGNHLTAVRLDPGPLVFHAVDCSASD